MGLVSTTDTVVTAGLFPGLFDGVTLLSPQLMTMVDATRATAATTSRSVRIGEIPSLFSCDEYFPGDQPSSQATSQRMLRSTNTPHPR